MKEPRELSNDDLALNLEVWALLTEDLTTRQLSYFDEICWRLRLMPNYKEQEKVENE